MSLTFCCFQVAVLTNEKMSLNILFCLQVAVPRKEKMSCNIFFYQNVCTRKRENEKKREIK